MSKNNGKFVIGALVGAALGAAAGLLFAPRSGKETRKIVGKKAKEYAEKGKDLALKEKEAVIKAVDKLANKK